MASRSAASRVQSPELVLVDSALAEAARRELPLPDEASVSTSSTENDDRDVALAITRLTELSDVEPKRRRRGTRERSIAFAVCSWVTLAAVVVDTFPHGA